MIVNMSASAEKKTTEAQKKAIRSFELETARMEARRLYQSSIPTSTYANASRANSYSLAEVDGQIVSPGRKPQRGPHDVSRFNPSKTNVPVTSGHPACNERSTHGWRRTDGGLAAIPTGRSDDAPPRRSRAQSLSTHRCRQRVGMKHKQRPHWRWRQKNVSPARRKIPRPGLEARRVEKYGRGLLCYRAMGGPPGAAI